jgi:hypothetical protein
MTHLFHMKLLLKGNTILQIYEATVYAAKKKHLHLVVLYG